MASQQSHNLSHTAGEAAGHAQATRPSANPQDQSGNNQNASITAQASTFIQQTGEQVKNMAQGAADAVKNTLGINEDNTNSSNNPNRNNAAGNPGDSNNPSSNPNTNPRII